MIEINLKVNMESITNKKIIDWYFHDMKNQSLFRLSKTESPNK
jgi:hypothetical protein